MPLIRPKITPTVEPDGGVLLRVEWLTIDEGSNIVKDADGQPIVHSREECRIGPKRLGCGYVSEVGCVDADVGLPTFFVDPEGRRHFVCQAERHDEVLVGSGVDLAKG